MNIDPIRNGIVIDHITAGLGMKLYEFLKLEETEFSVAFIKNAASKKIGKKDIIKIDGDAEIDFDLIGYVAPNATVNIIRDGKIFKKKKIETPEVLTDLIKCKNPRCITSCEQEIRHIFKLVNKADRVYRCIYCETEG